MLGTFTIHVQCWHLTTMSLTSELKTHDFAENISVEYALKPSYVKKTVPFYINLSPAA